MQLEAEVTAAPSAISAFAERVTGFLDERGVDARTAHHVALIVDEMLTNLATHGAGIDRTAVVRIMVESDRVRGEIVDRGPPFDPRTAAGPDMSIDPADRPAGGLGLLLIKRLTSDLDYVRRDGRNCTTFAVPRTTSPRTRDDR